MGVGVQDTGVNCIPTKILGLGPIFLPCPLLTASEVQGEYALLPAEENSHKLYPSPPMGEPTLMLSFS